MRDAFRVIELTQGYVAIVDAEDYRRVNKYSWHVNFSKGTKKKPGEPYARARIDGQDVYLHRFVMKEEIDWMSIALATEKVKLHVDHTNHQTLDCRKTNLEVCTHQKNMLNKKKAKFKVIGYDKARGNDKTAIVIGAISMDNIQIGDIVICQQLG